MYKIILKVPLYPTRLGIIISNGFEKVNDYFKTQGMKEDIDFSQYDAITQQGVHLDKKGVAYNCIYMVFNPLEDGFTHGIINHEIRHVVNIIFENIGHRLDPSNDEPEAYLSQWVTDIVYGSINKSGNIDKIKLLPLYK